MSTSLSPSTAINQAPQALQSQSPLFRLSAELRNKIYELVLVRGRILIRGPETLPSQPALLQTCRRIRDEALSMYFMQNKFVFIMRNCDASTLAKWRAMSKEHAQAKARVRLVGPPNWDNLKVWVKGVWFGRILRGFDAPQSTRPLELACAKVFDIAYKAYVKRAGTGKATLQEDWAKFEDALEDVHEMMAILDQAWK